MALADGMGKKVIEQLKYPLIPSRWVYPDAFPFSVNSIESKRAILMSLSPMLTGSDKQKQSDTKSCEEYTRCKVCKGNSRSSPYDYHDIDIDIKIDPSEYERRYLLWLASKPKLSYASNNNLDQKRSKRSASNILPKTVDVLVSNKSLNDDDDDDDDGDDDDDDDDKAIDEDSNKQFESVQKIVSISMSSKKKEAEKTVNKENSCFIIGANFNGNIIPSKDIKKEKKNGRRETLSPASAKSIIMSEVNTDDGKVSNICGNFASTHEMNENSGCNEAKKLSDDVSDDTIQEFGVKCAEIENAETKRKPTIESTEYKTTIQLEFTDEETKTAEEWEEYERLESLNLETEKLRLHSNKIRVMKTLETEMISNSSKENTQNCCSLDNSKVVDKPQFGDEEERIAKEKAYIRLCVRLEKAKAQYVYELVQVELLKKSRNTKR